MQVVPWLQYASVGFISDDQSSFQTLTDHNHAMVVAVLEDAMTYYKAMNFNPPALRCIQGDTGGRYAFKWALASEMDDVDDLGDYTSPRCGAGNDRGIVRFNLHELIGGFDSLRQGLSADGEEISTPPHELFHAIQGGYPAFEHCPGNWAWEGLAEAMAFAWLQDYDARNGCTINLENRPQRFFSDPLHRSDPGDLSQAYGTSFLWEFLAREPNYYVDMTKVRTPFTRQVTARTNSCRASKPFNPYLISKFLNMSEADYQSVTAQSGGLDWDLKWLDKLLADELNKAVRKVTGDSGNLKGGLYVVYPKFISWYADSVTAEDLKNMPASSTPHSMQAAEHNALQKIFKGGCETLTLKENEVTKTDPAKPLEIERLAAICIKVEFDDTDSDFYYVYTSGTNAKEQLHLGFRGNDESRLDGEAGSQQVRWLVMAKPGNKHMYLVLSNVAPVAAETTALTIDLSLDFMSKGKGSSN